MQNDSNAYTNVTSENVFVNFENYFGEWSKGTVIGEYPSRALYTYTRGPFPTMCGGQDLQKEAPATASPQVRSSVEKMTILADVVNKILKL